VHEEVLQGMVDFSLRQGYDVYNMSYSPITGGDGNIEFLLHLRWKGERELGENQAPLTVREVVEEAHKTLKEKK
jgi:23S rRNA (cytidine1920-2'-O)/16S rRNA (cytidine1409-2'-O)-methyltransferase